MKKVPYIYYSSERLNASFLAEKAQLRSGDDDDHKKFFDLLETVLNEGYKGITPDVVRLDSGESLVVLKFDLSTIAGILMKETLTNIPHGIKPPSKKYMLKHLKALGAEK